MLQFNPKKPITKKQPPNKAERRRYTRFPVMYHLDVPVTVRILPHYRSEELDGRLENFSAGGMSLHLPALIPEKKFLYLQVTLPNRLSVACHAEVRHFKKKNSYEYSIGIQFLDLPTELKNLIMYMSREYIECGKRIKEHKKSDCITTCTAYAVCSRHEKITS